MEKEQQIRQLENDKTLLEERAKVLEIMLASCRDDFGAKIPQQTKELMNLVNKLQAEAKTHADKELEKENIILELKFDKEDLKRTVSRLQAKIEDFELVSKLGGGPSASSNSKREAELQSVVTALQNVAEKLRVENESLKKSTVPNTKYVEVNIRHHYSL